MKDWSVFTWVFVFNKDHFEFNGDNFHHCVSDYYWGIQFIMINKGSILSHSQTLLWYMNLAMYFHWSVLLQYDLPNISNFSLLAWNIKRLVNKFIWIIFQNITTYVVVKFNILPSKLLCQCWGLSFIRFMLVLCQDIWNPMINRFRKLKLYVVIVQYLKIFLHTINCFWVALLRKEFRKCWF